MEVGGNNEQSTNLAFYPLAIFSPIFKFLSLGFCFSFQLHTTVMCFVHLLINSFSDVLIFFFKLISAGFTALFTLLFAFRFVFQMSSICLSSPP